jgi:D-3-phosphoglycerate dehydrogenase
MKLLCLGDLFLPDTVLREVIAPRLHPSLTLETWQWDTGGLENLQRHNLACEQHGPEAVEAPAGLLEAVANADFLFTQFCPVNRAVLDAAKSLKLVAVGRTGVQNIDVPGATARGIPVINTVGRNAHAVAEYAIGLMLAEMRNISRAHAALKQGQWRKNYRNDACVPELPGRTLGLVGFGQIGRLMVKKLAGFEMQFLVYDPYVSAEALAGLGCRKVDLEELLRASDFVSLHAKLTDDTRHLIHAGNLPLMKPTAYLINTARAELVDETALAHALANDLIAGAALDVFMHEPPAADDPLLALDNITLSPHQAGVTTDAYRTTARLFAENLARLWTGSTPANLVNPDTLPRLQALSTSFPSTNP